MKKNKKNGFSLIELIFVIIILGVLSGVAMNTLNTSIRSDAINNILGSVRFTQHLAITDNKMNPESKIWQRSLWTLKYNTCNGKISYTIGSDSNYNQVIEVSESAISSINNKFIYTSDTNCASNKFSSDIFLGEKYYINSINYTDCGSDKSISFDYLGRPHHNIKDITIADYKSLNKKDCIIKFNFKDNMFKPIYLKIRKESGFASITGREGL